MRWWCNQTWIRYIGLNNITDSKKYIRSREEHLRSAWAEVCGPALCECLVCCVWCVFYLTLVIQLSSVLGEAFEAHPLAEQIQELIKCRSSTLVVVHLFFCALACLAVKHSHLVLEAQLEWGTYTDTQWVSIISCCWYISHPTLIHTVHCALKACECPLSIMSQLMWRCSYPF